MTTSRRKRKPPEREKTVTFTFRIPIDLKAAVEAAARSEDRSTTSFITHVLRKMVKMSTAYRAGVLSTVERANALAALAERDSDSS